MNIEALGLIAGAGSLPAHVYDACIKRGIRCVVIGVEDYIDPEFATLSEALVVPPFNVSKVIKYLHKNNIKHIVFVGRVGRASISKLLLDLKGAILFTKIIANGMNDNAVLVTIINFFEKEGFVVLSPESIASNLIIHKGASTNIKPTRAAMNDIKKALRILHDIAALDVGQALIIQSGLVLGVEAAEGTDELIIRCGKIQQKNEAGAILVKISKPNQDHRIDLPCIGLHTMKMLHQYGMQGVAIEAGLSLILDKEQAIEFSNDNNLFIYGINTEN